MIVAKRQMTKTHFLLIILALVTTHREPSRLHKRYIHASNKIKSSKSTVLIFHFVIHKSNDNARNHFKTNNTLSPKNTYSSQIRNSQWCRRYLRFQLKDVVHAAAEPRVKMIKTFSSWNEMAYL